MNQRSAGVKDQVIIQSELLSKQAFKPYGDVLETDGVEPESINFGNTLKFAGLANVAMLDGKPGQLSIYRSRAIELPFRIHLMERHPLGSQAFYPLHDRPFLVVVATGQAVLREKIRVFRTNGRQGVNIHAGIWHHYQLSPGHESDYIVVDRAQYGTGDNYEEYQLDENILVNL
jgi:ureidoglycolate lyase